MENLFIFGLFLGNPHLKNEKKPQSADNRQNFEILVPLRAKHLKPHNNRLVTPANHYQCQLQLLDAANCSTMQRIHN